MATKDLVKSKLFVGTIGLLLAAVVGWAVLSSRHVEAAEVAAVTNKDAPLVITAAQDKTAPAPVQQPAGISVTEADGKRTCDAYTAANDASTMDALKAAAKRLNCKLGTIFFHDEEGPNKTDVVDPSQKSL